MGVATTCSGKAGERRQAQQHAPKVKHHSQRWADGRKEGWKPHPIANTPPETASLMQSSREYLKGKDCF